MSYVPSCPCKNLFLQWPNTSDIELSAFPQPRVFFSIFPAFVILLKHVSFDSLSAGHGMMSCKYSDSSFLLCWVVNRHWHYLFLFRSSPASSPGGQGGGKEQTMAPTTGECPMQHLWGEQNLNTNFLFVAVSLGTFWNMVSLSRQPVTHYSSFSFSLKFFFVNSAIYFTANALVPAAKTWEKLVCYSYLLVFNYSVCTGLIIKEFEFRIIWWQLIKMVEVV